MEKPEPTHGEIGAALGRLHAAATVVAADQPVSVLAGDVHVALNLLGPGPPAPEPPAV